MTDPLDNKLVEAVLAPRPARAKREPAAAKTASARPKKGAAAVAAPAPVSDEDGADEFEEVEELEADMDPDIALGADPDAVVGDLSIELVGEEAIEGVPVPAGVDAPPKLSAAEVEEPSPKSSRRSTPT